MGILVQPIVGMDFEAAMDKQIKTEQKKIDEGKGGKKEQVEALQAKKIKVLQQLAYHRRPPYIGFIHLENNGVNVPKHGHERFYDETCNWIIVPTMTLQNILNWHHEKGEYWVMCIAGNLNTANYGAYRNLIQASQSEDEDEVVYVDGRERCTKDDVENGIANLRAFVCAFADLATGRGANKLTPLDLIEKGQEPIDLEDLKKASTRLKAYEKVLVPKLQQSIINFNTVEIMKLRIGHAHLTSKLPEPMAFAAKGALNFMSLTGEKATPGCGSDEEESQEEETESFVELYPLASVAPMTPPKVPQSISIVTPPSQLERSNSSDDSWDL